VNVGVEACIGDLEILSVNAWAMKKPEAYFVASATNLSADTTQPFALISVPMF